MRQSGAIVFRGNEEFVSSTVAISLRVRSCFCRGDDKGSIDQRGYYPCYGVRACWHELLFFKQQTLTEAFGNQALQTRAEISRA